MAIEPLTTEQLQEVVTAYRECNYNRAETARRLGKASSTVWSNLKQAAKHGLMGTRPVMPGFQITSVSTLRREDGSIVHENIRQKPEREGTFFPPEGHRIKGVSALVDSDGNVIQQWFKTREGELDPLAVVDAIKETLDGYERPGPPSPAPDVRDDDLLTLYPLGDAHIGLHVWHKDGEADWDLKIAERVIGNAMQAIISSSPPASNAVILLGGDTLHADNGSNMTPRSGNTLDVDGRYQKIIGTACRLVVNMIEWALTKHQHVTVRLLRGNHDDHASVAVQYHLAAWFRSEPRVTVDLDPGLFWWHRFGKVLLGATHGHEAGPKEMPGLMAMRRPEDWGATVHRYVHTFHLHRSEKTISTNTGVVCEIHETPIPKDGWAYGRGFQSGRSVQSITYHRETGYRGRCVETIADG
mgnify:CR=1 FL=1